MFYTLWYKLLNAGTRFERHLQWLRSLQYATREEIYEFQVQALKNLFTHCYRNVPFYRKSWHARDFDPSDFRELESLCDVPVTTRSDLRANFPRNTCSHNVTVLRRLHKYSSGTTGAPIEFYNDRGNLGIRLSSRFLHNEWLGMRLTDRWIRMTHHQAAYRALVNEAQVSTLAATRSRASNLIHYITRSGARGIVALPSVLRILSDALLSEHQILHPPLKAVVSTGEMLLPTDRTRMSSAFGVDVCDRYSAQEVPGEWAQQCTPNGEMHWNPGIVFLEVRRGDHVAKMGERGQMLVTDLWNRVMPLVRYEVGDEVKAGGACSCGRTWATINGPIERSQDYLVLRNGEHVTVADFATRIAHEFGREIIHFQFIETGESAYRVRTVLDPRIRDFDRFALKDYLSHYLRDVVIEGGEPITLPSGKSPILVKP